MYKEKCNKCYFVASDLLINEKAFCKIRQFFVYKISIACDEFLPYNPPFQHCNNCINFRKLRNGEMGCRKKICFPKQHQIEDFTCCNEFEPRAKIFKEAYYYYKKKSELIEQVIRLKKNEFKSIHEEKITQI